MDRFGYRSSLNEPAAVSDQETAVLVGDMNLLRCFGQSRISTFIVSTKARDVIRYSKYYRGGTVVADPGKDPVQFISDLVVVGKSFRRKPALYVLDDSALLAVSRQRDVLDPYFLFLLPPLEMVEDLVNKTRFALLAENLALPAPKTLVSAQIQTAADIVSKLGLPCIFKADSRHYGWYQLPLFANERRTPSKVLRAETPEEVAHLLDDMRRYMGRFVVQSSIPGGPDCIYSFHTYYNRRSEPVVSFAGRKVRTYPKDSGTSTCLELVKDRDVTELGHEVLRKLRFVGPAKLDFMRDPRNGRLYLLEVNARYTLWNWLGAASGANIPLAAWSDLHNEDYPRQREYRTDVKWVALRDDVFGFLHGYHKDKELTWWQWLRSYKGPKVYPLFSWDDPVPFLVNILTEKRDGDRKRIFGDKQHASRP